MFVENVKKSIGRVRRRAYEVVSISKPKRPALNQLDIKLEKYLNYKNGFFVEVGANDGFAQSNTYYFEKVKGWRGILIEGIPELYEKCRKSRKKSRVFKCALVSSDFADKYIKMHYANLMSIVEGARGDNENDIGYVRQGLEIQKIQQTYSVQVPARTLTSILDECKVKRSIDLLSLDVEGYELEVLKGLDLERYRPNYICVEAWERKGIDDYILNYYELVEELTERDILYKVR